MRYLNRFLLLASLFVVSTVPTAVQAVDKPSVPQFSLKLIDESYDVAPTTSTHPYTGETTTVPGYRRIQINGVITIKNQPFKPSADEKEKGYVLFYVVEMKGHFEDTWFSSGGQKTFQSNSGYTTIRHSHLGSYGSGSQLDFRVRAVIGQPGWWMNYVYYEDGNGPYFYTDVVCSDWSDVQTVTVEYGEYEGPSTVSPTNPESSIQSPSDNYDPPPLPQQTPWATYLLIIIATVCIITVPLVIVIYHNKHHQHKRKAECSSNNSPNPQFTEACEVKK